MTKITVVVKEPGKTPEVKEIDDTLESMQEVVGGYIELVAMPNNLDFYVNEEGLAEGLPFNTHIRGVPVVGTVFAASRNSSGDTIGLTKSQIDKVMTLI